MSASELFHANSTKRTVRSRALAGFARLKGHADENFGVRELARFAEASLLARVRRL